MREIKFRAWNKNTKKMVCPHKLTPLALHPDCVEMKGVFIPFHDDYILMQFTGLLDKNGVEIYEGDVVREKDPLMGTYMDTVIAPENMNSRVTVWLTSEWEVIGNIHAGTKEAKDERV